MYQLNTIPVDLCEENHDHQHRVLRSIRSILRVFESYASKLTSADIMRLPYLTDQEVRIAHGINQYSEPLTSNHHCTNLLRI